MKATLADRTGHIKEAIANIRALVESSSAEEIKRDPIRRAALERFLEIISEASRHIPEERRAEHADVPWRNIADIGNRLRHVYDDVDLDILFVIATKRLDALEAAIDRILAEEKTADRRS
jgi:uncharacterized protein with HEPN domain